MTVVYRLYADDGDLLYIGMSDHLEDRLAKHRSSYMFRDRPWARVETVDYPDRLSAHEAEAEAIFAEEPRLNIQHNWTRVERERGPWPTFEDIARERAEFVRRLIEEHDEQVAS